VYAAVTVGGRKYFLDATNKYTPYYMTPFDILNSTAFITNNENGGLVDVSEDKFRYWENVAIDEQLSPDGKLTGNVQIISKDYARVVRLRDYEIDKKQYVENEIKKDIIGITIDKFAVENENVDTLALKQTFSFNAFAQNTGEYTFLNLNLFSAIKSNPFLSDNRFSDINFGYKKAINLNTVITIPAEFKIDGIPKTITLTNTDKTVTVSRTITYNEDSHQLVARLKIEHNKSLYPVNEYADVKEFYKKMIDLLNEPVVLKKI
jgi:hypothetical protein